MILEGIVTTVSPAGKLNVAPMGPFVDDDAPNWPTELLLRPFPTSTTYANLTATGVGVFHVTDDVLLLAKSAIGDVDPPTQAARLIEGRRLVDCCRFFEFRIVRRDDNSERPKLYAKVVCAGTVRDSFGFNRAKHAVLEAAILATRIHITEKSVLLAELERLKIPVDKTAGQAEREAFELVSQYIRSAVGE